MMDEKKFFETVLDTGVYLPSKETIVVCIDGINVLKGKVFSCKESEEYFFRLNDMISFLDENEFFTLSETLRKYIEKGEKKHEI